MRLLKRGLTRVPPGDSPAFFWTKGLAHCYWLSYFTRWLPRDFILLRSKRKLEEQSWMSLVSLLGALCAGAIWSFTMIMSFRTGVKIFWNWQKLKLELKYKKLSEKVCFSSHYDIESSPKKLRKGTPHKEHLSRQRHVLFSLFKKSYQLLERYWIFLPLEFPRRNIEKSHLF